LKNQLRYLTLLIAFAELTTIGAAIGSKYPKGSFGIPCKVTSTLVPEMDNKSRARNKLGITLPLQRFK
jgi:hypothetical protein